MDVINETTQALKTSFNRVHWLKHFSIYIRNSNIDKVAKHASQSGLVKQILAISNVGTYMEKLYAWQIILKLCDACRNAQKLFVDEHFIKNVIKTVSPENPFTRDFFYFQLSPTHKLKNISFYDVDNESHKNVTQIFKLHNENSDDNLHKLLFVSFGLNLVITHKNNCVHLTGVAGRIGNILSIVWQASIIFRLTDGH